MTLTIVLMQELREKTKREAAELDTKKEPKDEKLDEFSFDDVQETVKKSKKPVKKISVKVLPPKIEAVEAVPTAPKGRGRPPKGRGRPRKNAVRTYCHT